MLSYEEFKEQVSQRLAELIRQEYPDVTVSQNIALMNNRSEDTLLFQTHCDGMNVSPTMYLSKLYLHYVQQGDLDILLHQSYLAICERLRETEEVRTIFNDQGALQDRITFELIHTEQNKELLETVPHREFQDLSIIYNCSFETPNLKGTACVTHKLAEYLDITEEELYAFAYENTRKVHKPIVRPLEDVLLYTMFHAYDGKHLEQIPERDGTLLAPLYMLTNCEEQKGAVSMLYPEELEKLAEKLDSDLYIMPASVDMVLVTNTQNVIPERLAQIVYEMNFQALPLEERLSNQIYHYDRQTQGITLATNTEHTMLSEEPEQPENDIEPEEEVEGMSMGMGV